MQQIDWNKLGLKGESKQKSFEDLCMFLCCRELKITKIDAYQNQPGIETEPFEANGKKYGFQAKFFESGFDWEQIKHSIVGKKDNKTKSKKLDVQYPYNVFKKYTVNKLFIYTNKDKSLNGRNKTNPEKLIEDLANKYGVKVEYITDKHLLLKLSQPSNLDLAQLYFGIGDELSFIRNSVNPDLLTFIQSLEYLELPFIDNENNKIDAVSESILSEQQNTFLLLGHPGSGKSVFIHKLLQIFGGLDQKDKTEMIKVLTHNNAVPVLVNLKNCVMDSLENIVRSRKNDCKVNSQELDFIYLFDGLDELTEKNADNILFQMYELSQRSDTKKIIISCRSGNFNRLKAKTYFDNIVEYRIANLKEEYLYNFFNAKNNKSKEKKLKELKKANPDIIKDVKDILFIKLLWDTIQELDESSTILDLFSTKIDLLLDDSSHRKNIDDLNLLSPKKEKIIELNQVISFEFQKEFQFRFSQNDLQELILKKFDRLDYKSTNTIINYIADLFFENSYSDNLNSETTHIYQHRRYQEYFFTQKLKIEYEMNPRIIRELKVISNHDYFEELFLKYLRKEYEQENNLAGLVELNLIDVYLGNHKGFGVDDDYYMNSSEFIPALVCQETNIFNELFEDENLQIRNKISIDFNEINDQFEKWKKNKNDYFSNDYLKRVWESGISSLIQNIVLFWNAEKYDIANEFIEQLQNITELYEENKYLESLSENDLIRDPFLNQFENFVYYRLLIKNEDVKDVFDNLIRRNYDKFSSEMNYSFEESGKEKLVKSFFRVCLREKKEDIFEQIDDFDEYEFIAFLDVLKTIDYLPVFIQSKSIHNKIKSFTKTYPQKLTETTIFILFYKKFFNLELSHEEQESAKTELSRLRDKERVVWHMYKTHIDFSLISYVLDEFSFGKFLKKQEGHQFRYYNELGLYSALFKDFIALLKEEKNIEALVRDYIRYINFYIEGTNYGQYLKTNISFLWADIFSNSNIDEQSLLKLKNVLIKEENNIIYFSFYLQLNRLRPKIFNQLINESELKPFEDNLLSWDDDFPSYVDRCFYLSIFFSIIDSKKAKFYFEKGINEGILRHGWHKDIIVSYLLADAFEIIWKNNWVSKEIKKNYAEQVFNLALRVSEITDGDHTRWGPYRLIKIISENELELAEEFKKLLIEREGYSNFSNSVITSILINKVRLGSSIEEIEKGMGEYRKDYSYESKPQSDYYEQRFIVYLEIAECDLYTDEEKKTAFEKAYNQVEEIKKQNIEYYLSDDDFKNEKQIFKKLCQKYEKPFKLEFDKKEEFKRISKISEGKFIEEVKKSKTPRQIQGKYKKLNNYNNGIVLTKYESWGILMEKTFEINGDVKLFTKYLTDCHFPHIVGWTSNSDYLHLGLAVALKNINTRQEALKYLYKDSGHGGFVNIMRAYEFLGDKNMCLLLFDRYLKFCELIVN